jgi:hypothetical protein
MSSYSKRRLLGASSEPKIRGGQSRQKLEIETHKKVMKTCNVVAVEGIGEGVGGG